jgi:hypothetical protein
MLRIACIAATLLLSPDFSHVFHLRSQGPPADSQNGAAISAQSDAGDSVASSPSHSDGPLTQESRLEIIRYVSGEFAKMNTSLPGGKNGFRLKAGKPVDKSALENAIRNAGAAVSSGDSVQITNIEFGSHDIAFDINGGPKGRTSWRDRIQLSMGGTISTSNKSSTPSSTPPPSGTTVYLDFDRSLPDMSADDVKDYLSEVFDFSNQRSAAVPWIETLPPNIREAVENKRAEVGMGREEVLAALGRPDRKVREREHDGTEIEDWIYGNPPTTTFVRFSGEKVVKVTQYPN